MSDISIIKFGTLSLEYGESPYAISRKLQQKFGKLGDSSITHIEHKGKHYLIDTGFANEGDFSETNLVYNKLELEFRFKVANLKFDDIAGIFITHWHEDHFANLRLFPNAQIYTYEEYQNVQFHLLAKYYKFEDRLPIIFLKEGDKFADCTVLPTPGHTQGHCSLLANFMDLHLVIAGDAIVSQSYFNQGKVWPYNLGNLGDIPCIASMNRIIDLADYIIPGHGHPFQNYKKPAV
jgi:glyoxylase-like metal-dependent hydrolase (beta-lactamase superfamily II)